MAVRCWGDVFKDGLRKKKWPIKALISDTSCKVIDLCLQQAMASLKASAPTNCASTVVLRFTGHPSVLLKVLALERRTFSKADSWAGVSCSLRHFPQQLLIYTARVIRALQLGLSAAATGILDNEVKRRNTLLLYASLAAELDKVK